MMMRILPSVVLVVGVACVARGDEATSLAPGDIYITHTTIERGEIALAFDAAELARQGWSIAQDEFLFPVAAGMDNAIQIMTLNGELLTLSGTPQVLGVIDVDGPGQLDLSIAGFALPFQGSRDVPFLDGRHPMFEIDGDTIAADVRGAQLTISGQIRLATSAGEYGLDPSVGAVGEFTLRAPVDVIDLDATVAPPPDDNGGASGPNAENPAADMIFASLPNMANWGEFNGIRAYSVADVACNIGTEPLDWFAGPNPFHPVMAQNIYRLRDGRFEQLGQSWIKHGFCALQQSLCQTCIPVGNCCCSQLGVGCSDPYSASRNGGFSNLGPRREIDAHQGTNLGTYVLSQGNATIRGRIQVHESDLSNPGQGDLFFIEGHYVAQDDAQTGDMTGDNNNASWREMEFTGANYIAEFPEGSTTHREQIAMYAWKDTDPQVTIAHVDVPNEGRFTVGYRATDNGDGTWHYEYALHNLSSDRSAGAFVVPIGSGVVLQNVGFHDVDYHSDDADNGSIYALDNWSVTEGEGFLTWTAESWDENENANALRWGTLYNFRFDANTEPQLGEIEIGMFKPGTPTAVTVQAMVPAPACATPAFVPGVAGVSFGDRAFDGFIDALAESTNGIDVDLGLDRITLEFTTAMENLDGTPLSTDAFAITDTGGSPPDITGISTDDDRIVTLLLDGHITLQEWTTIAVSARAQCDANLTLSDAVDIGYLPADVDNNGTVTPFDLLMFRQYVNEIDVPNRGLVGDYVDTDRDGDVSPFDLLAFRQLINGVSPPATRSWNAESLPPQP